MQACGVETPAAMDGFVFARHAIADEACVAFVATNGDDNNGGDVKTPLKTLGAALARLRGAVSSIIRKCVVLSSSPREKSERERERKSGSNDARRPLKEDILTSGRDRQSRGFR